MNIVSCYNIDAVIRMLETALQIDASLFEERDVDTIIATVKRRIAKQYQINLEESKINDLVFETGLYRDAAALYIESVTVLHSKICGLCQMQRYTTSTPISLSNINFLGFTESSLKAFLIVLQRQKTMPSASEAIIAIKEKLGVISICLEKRLFMLIVVADAIGFPEVVAAVAEMLYQSMIR